MTGVRTSSKFDISKVPTEEWDKLPELARTLVRVLALALALALVEV